MHQYLGAMSTVSVALLAATFASLWLKRPTVAAFGFLTLAIGATAIVWDHWSARTGHHMELIALTHPVALTNREVFLLLAHGPFLAVGAALLLVGTSPNRHGTADGE